MAMRYSSSKNRSLGLWEAFNGRVPHLCYKEQELADVGRILSAKRYVMIDDSASSYD